MPISDKQLSLFLSHIDLGVQRIDDQPQGSFGPHDLSNRTDAPPKISVLQARNQIGISRIQTWIPVSAVLQDRTEIGISRIQIWIPVSAVLQARIEIGISRIQILIPVSAVLQARTEIGISRIQIWIPDCQHWIAAGSILVLQLHALALSSNTPVRLAVSEQKKTAPRLPCYFLQIFSKPLAIQVFSSVPTGAFDSLKAFQNP
jgi:hypothetical protein